MESRSSGEKNVGVGLGPWNFCGTEKGVTKILIQIADSQPEGNFLGIPVGSNAMRNSKTRKNFLDSLNRFEVLFHQFLQPRLKQRRKVSRRRPPKSLRKHPEPGRHGSSGEFGKGLVVVEEMAKFSQHLNPDSIGERFAVHKHSITVENDEVKCG